MLKRDAERTAAFQDRVQHKTLLDTDGNLIYTITAVVLLTAVPYKQGESPGYIKY